MNPQKARDVAAGAALLRHRAMASRIVVDDNAERFDSALTDADDAAGDMARWAGQAMAEGEQDPCEVAADRLTNAAGRMAAYAEQVRRQAELLEDLANDLHVMARAR